MFEKPNTVYFVKYRNRPNNSKYKTVYVADVEEDHSIRLFNKKYKNPRIWVGNEGFVFGNVKGYRMSVTDHWEAIKYYQEFYDRPPQVGRYLSSRKDDINIGYVYHVEELELLDLGDYNWE
jgi:hypothetical protein